MGLSDPKTLAEIFEENLRNGDNFVEAQAHAALTEGDCVALDANTGLTAAPSNNDRDLFLGVATHAIASGDTGKFAVGGRVKAKAGAAVATGELCDVSADLKADPLGTQTDGNGSLRALEAAAAEDDLFWARFE